jgi:hypothetical protein
VVQDSWIHDLSVGLGDHNDGIQRFAPGATYDDVIRHNTIQAPANENAAIFYADDWRGRLVLDDNKLSGGGYTVRIYESGQASVTNNIIGIASAGPVDCAAANVPTWSGNVDDNGDAIATCSAATA